MLIKKAIIPAAGLGTRFLPATKAQPKEMIPIIDKPAIQYIVEEAVASGIEEILIITGKNSKAIKDHFKRSIELENILEKKGQKKELEIIRKIPEGKNIKFIEQKEPKGLGDAILLGEEFVDNQDFAVLLADDIIQNNKSCLRQMLDIYKKYRKTILGITEVSKENVSSYGIIKYNQIEDRIYNVIDLFEKPSQDKAPSNRAIVGRYILSPSIFKYLENQKPGILGEIQLTDALRRMVKDEEIYAYEFIGNRYDIGNKLGYLKASLEIGLKRDDLKNEILDHLKTIIRK